ncbi:MAG: hypothetical protein ACF8SC_11165, partial [Phycisphaerales bacterium JB037]
MPAKVSKKKTKPRAPRTPVKAGSSSTPTPAHQGGSIRARTDWRLYQGDCRAILPTIPECAQSKVDLIFADPPFNWARDYDRHQTGDAWDDAS